MELNLTNWMKSKVLLRKIYSGQQHYLAKLGPQKKPTAIQDQIATDEHGKRRFHGAFTGGFSAGYWNTVGSKEGCCVFMITVL